MCRLRYVGVRKLNRKPWTEERFAVSRFRIAYWRRTVAGMCRYSRFVLGVTIWLWRRFLPSPLLDGGSRNGKIVPREQPGRQHRMESPDGPAYAVWSQL